jgi:soluble P-type ATPase
LIAINIPGFKHLELAHLVLDYNGTLAVDGILLPGVRERLQGLAADVHIHVVTADTFGEVRATVADLPCTLHILPRQSQAEAKRDYVRGLDAAGTVCIGNGRNDRLMLAEAALGIAVILGEGASGACIAAADVICRDINEALDLLRHPLRLTATLRS